VAISRAVSRWIASAVFFLWRQRILDRARVADLFIYFEQVAAELSKAMKGLHLALCLEQFGR